MLPPDPDKHIRIRIDNNQVAPPTPIVRTRALNTRHEPYLCAFSNVKANVGCNFAHTTSHESRFVMGIENDLVGRRPWTHTIRCAFFQCQEHGLKLLCGTRQNKNKHQHPVPTHTEATVQICDTGKREGKKRKKKKAEIRRWERNTGPRI